MPGAPAFSFQPKTGLIVGTKAQINFSGLLFPQRHELSLFSVISLFRYRLVIKCVTNLLPWLTVVQFPSLGV